MRRSWGCLSKMVHHSFTIARSMMTSKKFLLLFIPCIPYLIGFISINENKPQKSDSIGAWQGFSIVAPFFHWLYSDDPPLIWGLNNDIHQITMTGFALLKWIILTMSWWLRRMTARNHGSLNKHKYLDSIWSSHHARSSHNIRSLS
jgi:hypothetical protein